MVSDPLALLTTLCGQPVETEWLEFKVNKFEHDRCGQYISGLANSAILAGKNYGYLVFGVDDKTHEVVGTTIRLKSELHGNENFEHWLSCLLHPSIPFEIIELDVDGRHVEIIRITPSYVSPVRFKNETHIRVSSVLKNVRDYPERERALWAATSRISFERGVAAPHYTAKQVVDNCDLDALFARLIKKQISPQDQIKRLLMNELITSDDEGGYDVSNLLALLCARDLRKYGHLQTKSVRTIRYKGTSKIVGVEDIQGGYGIAITFSKALKYIMERVEHKEEMSHGSRIAVYSIPEIAVRELLANCLIHQDLTVSGAGPKVEVYTDRIVFSNPGEPLIDTNRLIDAPPRSRNEKLAGFMRALGHCEQRGSGIDRAIEAVEKAICPPPLFQAVEGSTLATLYTRRPGLTPAK